MSVAAILDRMVTYNEELLVIKLHDPSVTWFYEITRQIKYFISPFALDQWSPNMARW